MSFLEIIGAATLALLAVICLISAKKSASSYLKNRRIRNLLSGVPKRKIEYHSLSEFQHAGPGVYQLITPEGKESRHYTRHGAGWSEYGIAKGFWGNKGTDSLWIYQYRGDGVNVLRNNLYSGTPSRLFKILETY